MAYKFPECESCAFHHTDQEICEVCEEGELYQAENRKLVRKGAKSARVTAIAQNRVTAVSTIQVKSITGTRHE